MAARHHQLTITLLQTSTAELARLGASNIFDVWAIQMNTRSVLAQALVGLHSELEHFEA